MPTKCHILVFPCCFSTNFLKVLNQQEMIFADNEDDDVKYTSLVRGSLFFVFLGGGGG